MGGTRSGVAGLGVKGLDASGARRASNVPNQLAELVYVFEAAVRGGSALSDDAIKKLTSGDTITVERKGRTTMK